jgi:hypothetical protein
MKLEVSPDAKMSLNCSRHVLRLVTAARSQECLAVFGPEISPFPPDGFARIIRLSWQIGLLQRKSKGIRVEVA